MDVVGLGSGVQTIASGAYHTCVVTTAGGVKCWGGNDDGELGDDGGIDDRIWYSSTPVDVVGLSSGVQAIAAGGAHTCALTTGGAVKCWGGNDDGQLGNGAGGEEQFSTTPVGLVGLDSSVQAISAGGDASSIIVTGGHTCAVTTAGAVKCWGGNGDGQLGADTRWMPVVDVVTSKVYLPLLWR